MEPLDLRQIIDEVIEIYEYSAEDAQLEIVTACPRELTIDADPTRLRQVLANLLDNAIKYSRSGGKVTIDAQQNDESTTIVVTDEGIGIAPEEIGKVWDRLYRGDKSRSQPGLGVGLSLVRAVVHAHGGGVAVESVLGKGSVFSISLPRRTQG